MRALGRLISVAAAVATVAWWCGRAGEPPRRELPRIDVARGVVTDLAGIAGRGLRWHVAAMTNDAGTQSAVTVTNLQDTAARVRGSGGLIYVETPSWDMTLDLTRVTEVVCVRRFIHEPQGLTLDVSFRKGPADEYGYPDEMFEVQFRDGDADVAEFDRVCDEHALRRDDDRDLRP